ncbi:MAG: nucleoside triphosphate pyrophosphohydrolase [Candidatus Bipolaricaulota bacterium]|nr:nucleoside triphosphate pyrophosphohydrolase [Candidatus Bipolaricaulota bacterium]
MASSCRKICPKLVRDKIPELIMRSGKRPVFRRAQGAELKKYADAKVLEEAKEFAKLGDLDELTDLLEAIYFRLQLEGISAQEAHERMMKKRHERGGFEGGVILERIERI